MQKKNFLKNYFEKFLKLLNFSEKDYKNLILVSELILGSKKNSRKTLIFG